MLPLLLGTSQAISKDTMLVVRRAALVARRVVAKAPVAARSRFSTYTVAAIEDGDDAAWRKLLSDADFLAAVETSDELAEAFVKRMDQQTVEISRLGVPEGNDPEIWTYAAHLFSHEDPAVLVREQVRRVRPDLWVITFGYAEPRYFHGLLVHASHEGRREVLRILNRCEEVGVA